MKYVVFYRIKSIIRSTFIDVQEDKIENVRKEFIINFGNVEIIQIKKMNFSLYLLYDIYSQIIESDNHPGRTVDEVCYTIEVPNGDKVQEYVSLIDVCKTLGYSSEYIDKCMKNDSYVLVNKLNDTEDLSFAWFYDLCERLAYKLNEVKCKDKVQE